MSRFSPKVITANRLREGDVVYLTVDDRWTPFHHEAELLEDEAHAQLRHTLLVLGRVFEFVALFDRLAVVPQAGDFRLGSDGFGQFGLQNLA